MKNVLLALALSAGLAATAQAAPRHAAYRAEPAFCEARSGTTTLIVLCPKPKAPLRRLPVMQDPLTAATNLNNTTIIANGAGLITGPVLHSVNAATLGIFSYLGSFATGTNQWTVSPSTLPAPTTSSLGAVFAGTAPSHQFLTAIGSTGALTFTQPAFGDISGVAAVGQGGTGATTFASGAPLFGNGTGVFQVGSLSGSGIELATVSGALVNGHCVSINAGNFIDAGAACGSSSGGSGTVTPGTTNQLAYYPSSASSVAGLNLSGLQISGSTLSPIFGTTAGTVAQGNDSRITNALQSTATALPSSFTSSMLTSLGTLGSLNVSGTGVASVFSAGTLQATGASGDIIAYDRSGGGASGQFYRSAGVNYLDDSAGGHAIDWASTTVGLLLPTTAPVFTVSNSSPTVINLYSSPPTDIVAASGGGPYISFYGLPGHVAGDSERTSVQINSTSKTNASVEETALNVAMEDNQGYTSSWVASTTYPANTFLHAGSGYPSNVYENTGACTSAASGSGPSGTSSGQIDGTCTWNYLYVDNDGKSGMLLSGRVESGGGQLWGAATDVVADAGALGAATGTPGGWMVGQEIDTSNYARDCPVGAPPYCFVTGLFLAGGSTYKGTAGIVGGGQATGSETYHQGVTLLSGFASDVGFNSATGNVGFQSNGMHGAYSFQDLSVSPTSIAINGGTHTFAGVFDSVSNVAFWSSGNHGANDFKVDSTSPTSINVGGNHSFAAYLDNSTSPIAIDLLGTYSTQISAHGFNVDGTGNTNISSTTASTSPTTGAIIDAGGLGVNGSVNVGGTLTATGTISGPGSGITALNATQLTSGTVPISTLGNVYIIPFTIRNVQLNTTGDTPITISLPTGFSLYFVNGVRVTNPSAVLSGGAAKVGIYTAASQGGTVVAAQQALTGITTTSQNTTGNMVQMSIVNNTTTSFNVGTLYFNVGTANGSSATVDVTINVGVQG